MSFSGFNAVAQLLCTAGHDDSVGALHLAELLRLRAAGREAQQAAELALGQATVILRQLRGTDSVATVFWCRGPDEDYPQWQPSPGALVLGATSPTEEVGGKSFTAVEWLCGLGARLKLDLSPSGADELSAWLLALQGAAATRLRELRVRCCTSSPKQLEMLDEAVRLLSGVRGAAMDAVDWAWDYRFHRQEPSLGTLFVEPPLPVLEGTLLALQAALSLCTAGKHVKRLELDLSSTDVGLPSSGGVSGQALGDQLQSLSLLQDLPCLRELNLSCGEVAALQEAPRVAAVVSRELTRCKELRVLRIDPCLLRMDSAEVSIAIAKMVSQLEHLEEFRRLDEVRSEFWAELRRAPALQLRALDLEYGDAIDREALAALVAGICAQPALEELHLTFTPCWVRTPDGGLLEQRLELTQLRDSPSLRSLHISFEDDERGTMHEWLRKTLGPRIEVIRLPSGLDEILSRIGLH